MKVLSSIDEYRTIILRIRNSPPEVFPDIGENFPFSMSFPCFLWYFEK